MHDSSRESAHQVTEEFDGSIGPFRTGPINYADIYSADGEVIALIPKGYVWTVPNAQLLAASWDLLQALQGVMKLIDDGWLVRDTMGDSEPGWAMRQIKPVQVLTGASIAIRKALGGAR